MRKLIRSIFRAEGEKSDSKASEVVHNTWDRYQVKKVGAGRRIVNQAKGTHKKKNWDSRILSTQQ